MVLIVNLARATLGDARWYYAQGHGIPKAVFFLRWRE